MNIALILACAGLAWLGVRLRNVSRELNHLRRNAEILQGRAEERARAADRFEHLLRAVTEHMDDGCLILDRDRRVRFANRAIAENFESARDPIGKTVIEIIRVTEVHELVSDVIREGKVDSRDFHWRGPQTRFIRVTVAPLPEPDSALILMHDLTRLKRLEETRSGFIANVSHELRTPLAMIKGYIETLLEGDTHDPEIQTRFLGKIEKHADRLHLLIEDLMTISSLESGEIELNVRPVDLAGLTARVIDDLSAPAARRNVEITNRISPDLKVDADAERLHQVLLNLLDNAIKYGRPRGKIEIGSRDAEDGAVEIRIRDDGPGIPPQALDRVFERFYRVDRARSREQGGTGLGLSIVKHIIHSHGGTVRVESEPGLGTIFSVTLPRQKNSNRTPATVEKM